MSKSKRPSNLVGDFKISFALIDNNRMKELNETYRGNEGSTDVLSFEIREPSEEGVFLLGEVVVSKDMAERQAKELGHSFEEEVAELIRHGVLHLLGKHHVNPDSSGHVAGHVESPGGDHMAGHKGDE